MGLYILYIEIHILLNFLLYDLRLKERESQWVSSLASRSPSQAPTHVPLGSKYLTST